MNKIDTTNWKEFRIKDVFTITRGMRFVNNLHEPGKIPYYSASTENNGITDYISNPLFTEKDALVYTTFGDCYYAEKEFTASDEISILKNKNITRNSGLFIASVINKNKYKYEFKQKAFKCNFENDIIKLPVHNIMCIDFDYIQDIVGEGGGSRYE